MAKDLVRQVGTQTWHVAPEWADVLFPSSRTESLPGLIEAQGGDAVKQGQGRRIVRLDVGGRGLYVKQYTGSRRLRRLPRKEWRVARWARRAGLATVEPVAACWQGGAFYVTAEAAGAQPLGELLYREYFEPAADEPPYPGHRPPELVRLYRRRLTSPAGDVPDPKTLAELIVRLLTELHCLGLRHTDLHPNNLLLVRDDAGWRLKVLDLLALEEMPGGQTVAEHLVQLNHFFEPLTTRTERLRVVRLLERQGLSLDGGPRGVEARTRRYRATFYRRRDRRCMRQSKYFRAVHTGSFVGMAATDWAARLPATEEGLAAALEIGRYVKRSRGGESGFAEMAGCRIFVKRDTEAGWRRPHGPWPRIIEDWLRGSRAERAWRRGQALLVRGVGTARPLVWVDRRHGLLGREGMIATEALEDFRPLEQVLDGLRGRPRASCLETVAREIRRLHDSGLSHRDLKAQNILLRRDGPSWRMALVDLEGLRRHCRPVRDGRRARDLMRLVFSWDWGYGVRDTVPGLGLCDCLRFLKTYLGPHTRQAITVSCRRRGSTAPAARLRWWWRAIRRAMDRKAAGKS